MMPGTDQDGRPRVAATSASSTALIGNVHSMPPLIPKGLQHAFRFSESTTLCGAAVDGLVLLADLVFPYRAPIFIDTSACQQCLAATTDAAVPEAPGPTEE